MKLKYIFASIVATLALAVSCTKEADQHYLKEIKVSNSYVSLATTEATNSATITVTATDSWTITLDEKTAKWLSVTPTSGSAGDTQVTFSAAAGEGNTAEVAIVSGTKTQFVNVIQGLASVTELTIGEVLTSPQGKTYKVTGAISGWYSNAEQYGNMYITDDTGTILIYGMADKDGKLKNYPIKSWGLGIGDVITVEGSLGAYNGTPQMVDVTLTKLVKSLIKVENVDPEDATIAKEGGDITVLLENKGEKLGVIIPEDAQSWLGISLLDGDVVVFTAAPNEGGDRETTVTFTTTDGGTEYTAEQTITQKGSILDVTVQEALAVIDKMADNETTSGSYRVSGVVAKVTELSTSYGNATYLISADGTEENAITVYRGMYIDGEKFTDEKQLAAGDVVVVLGKLQRYVKNGALTPEIATGSSLVSVDRPISVEDALKVVEALADGATSTESYFVKGIVTGANGIDIAYGNATFDITDDGKAESSALTVFRAKDFGNEKFTSADAFKDGDVVILTGKLQKYVKSEVVTPELTSGYLVGLIPGVAGGDDSGDDSGDDTGDDTGDEVTVASPYVLTVTSGANSSYAGNCDITIGDIVWNLNGNSQMDPWRIGGKSITDTDRTLYSKTPISFDVAKIEVEHGTVTDITVNSFTLIVSANADFSSPVSTLTGTVTANETTTFNRPDGVSWEKCYFKFVYNVTVSASSNKFVQFKKATFTE